MATFSPYPPGSLIPGASGRRRSVRLATRDRSSLLWPGCPGGYGGSSELKQGFRVLVGAGLILRKDGPRSPTRIHRSRRPAPASLPGSPTPHQCRPKSGAVDAIPREGSCPGSACGTGYPPDRGSDPADRPAGGGSSRPFPRVQQCQACHRDDRGRHRGLVQALGFTDHLEVAPCVIPAFRYPVPQIAARFHPRRPASRRIDRTWRWTIAISPPGTASARRAPDHQQDLTRPAETQTWQVEPAPYRRDDRLMRTRLAPSHRTATTPWVI